MPLSGYVDGGAGNPGSGLAVPGGILAAFGPGLRILDVSDPAAYTTCFTSGYGRSVMHAGSYLRCNGGVRRFSPEEILRLLHCPPGFRFPGGMTTRKRWQLAGNSLSVAAVREILRAFPGLVPEP